MAGTVSTVQAAPPEEAALPPHDFALSFPRLEADYLRRAYAEAGVILEYGSGGSTVLAAELGALTFSVESDAAWAKSLSDRIAPLPHRVRLHTVDVGPTGNWGMPRGPGGHARFHGYPLSVWDRPDFVAPDLVLVDGRFRAASLVAVLLRATRPTTVLFDDYARRTHYHGVERLARKDEMIGRMARFTVTPGVIPPEMVTEAIGWFADPR